MNPIFAADSHWFKLSDKISLHQPLKIWVLQNFKLKMGELGFEPVST